MKFTNYLVTPKGYYFEIAPQAAHDMGTEGYKRMAEAGCIFCADERSMYEKHIEVMQTMWDYEMEVEEIEGTYFVVQYLNGEYVYMDDRGFKCRFQDDDGDGISVTNSAMLAKALKEFEL